MDALLAVAGILTVAVITPGPNNFIVMGAAARGGFVAATPAIAGVVAGTLALLVLVWAGAGVVFAVEPRLRSALAFVGCLYLVWLGAMLVWKTFDSGGGGQTKVGRMPGTTLGLFAFQFLNPKSWVLVLTASAVASGGATGAFGLAVFTAMFVTIPCICLSLWAYAGSAIANWLRRPGAQRWFDRAMGALLMGSAGLLLA